MAIVRRSRHQWWVFLATMAGAMLAIADASASEMGGKGGRAVACGITGSVSVTCSPEGLVLDKGRVGVDRLAGGARSDGRSTLRVGRRPRLRIDAEDWEDRIDEDDDSDLPVRVWLRDMVRCLHHLIVPECNSRFPGTSASSAPSHLSQHLRC